MNLQEDIALTFLKQLRAEMDKYRKCLLNNSNEQLALTNLFYIHTQLQLQSKLLIDFATAIT